MQIDQLAPDFTLPDQNGNSLTLSALRGETVVLFFYPRASTPGCTAEACNFRDHHAELLARGLIVLGISPDSVKAQKQFAEKFSFSYPLLADADKSVAQRYEVLKEKNLYGKSVQSVERTTFLIAPDGRIRHIWHQVSPAEHAAELLSFLDQEHRDANG